ncbi:MAG: DUF4349 domain-containing protein [Nocardioidaceae bacterium]|nr:DUF4349 domain-containing protein [Nocardioidaceae bacterium]
MKTVSRPPRNLALAGVALLSSLLVAACSGDMDSASSDESLASRAKPQAEMDGPAADSIGAGEGGDAAGSAVAAGGDASDPDLVTAETSVIRVGAVILESEDVGDVVAQVESLAVSVGGDIANEETFTDTDGRQTRSRLTLTVPVDTFDESINEVETFGDPVSTTSNSEDVTAMVADVNSRVASAEESIAQLRRLFSQAKKLSDIITLERELSLREADLESLQAQQRTLAARTTMSAITINVSLPDEEQVARDQDQAGFIAGIKSGWDAMVTFVVGASHAVGLALPLGSLALALGLIGWIAVRRITPRGASPASE